MDWTALVVSIGFAIFGAVILPLAKQMTDTYIKDQRLKQWANGAISAAGKAYVAIAKARQSDPTISLGTLIDREVKAEANNLLANYQETAVKLNATVVDAQSRVKGELGVLLAADPTITVAPKLMVVPPGRLTPATLVDDSRPPIGEYTP